MLVTVVMVDRNLVSKNLITELKSNPVAPSSQIDTYQQNTVSSTSDSELVRKRPLDINLDSSPCRKRLAFDEGYWCFVIGYGCGLSRKPLMVR